MRTRAKRLTTLYGICLLTIIVLISAAIPNATAESGSNMAILRKVIAVIPADLPPTYFLDKRGKPAGFAIDVMNELGKRSGLTIEYVTTKGWDEAIQLVLDGKADLIPSLTINEQRKEILSFTKTVDSLLINLVVTNGNTSIHGIVPGLTLGVLNGSTPHNFLKKNQSIQLQTYNDLQTMLFGLLAGHVDGIVSLTNTIVKLASDAGIEEKIKVVGKPVIEAKRAIALRKGETELLTRLNREIESFVEGADYRQLYVKWYGKPKPYWTAKKVGWIMGGLLFALTTFFLIRSRQEAQKLLKSRKVSSELEQRLSLATASAEIGVWDWLIPENHLIWDDRMYRLYGLRAGEFSEAYEAWVAGLHPDDAERCEAEIKAALNRDRDYDIEFRVVRPDGTIRNLKAFAVVEWDDNGVPLRMTGVNYDITNLTQTGEALVSSLSMLSATLEATMDGVLAVDLAGHITLWNQRVIDLWQVPQELLNNKNVDSILPHVVAQMAQPEEFLDNVMKLYDDPEASSCDTLHLADGRIFLRSSQPQKVGETIVGRVWSFNDVTDLKEAEMALLQANAETIAANETLNAIVMVMSDWVWEVDSEGRYTYCSPQVEVVLGYTPDEMIGKTPFYFMPPEEAERVRMLRKVPIENREIIRDLKNWNLHKDGRQVLLCTNGVPIVDAAGSVVGYRGVGSDITEHERYEIEREQARIAAEAANLAKSRFLANMSHEIRTPMNGIIGVGYLALQQELTPKMHDYLSKITYSAESLMRILNDILDFSKIEADMLTIEEVEFSTAKLLDAITTLHAIAADEKGLELRLPSPNTLPLQLIGDPLRLQQILSNLISNAIKFTAQGTVDLSITVTGSNPDENRIQLQFVVQDTGIGIAQEQQEQLFSPFTQSDTSTTRQYGGTGLGLSICRSLVRMMGGTITLHSTPGTGSSFSFSLWFGYDAAATTHADRQRNGSVIINGRTEIRNPASTDTAVVTSRTRSVPGPWPKFPGVRILLVDDNELNISMATELLERVGILVTTAANGREAVEAVTHAGGNFDLILMDVEMPIMDGRTAAMKLRENWSATHLPIVAMTAHAMSEERERCLNCGMNDVLTKPVNPTVLFTMVADQTAREPVKVYPIGDN